MPAVPLESQRHSNCSILEILTSSILARLLWAHKKCQEPPKETGQTSINPKWQLQPWMLRQKKKALMEVQCIFSAPKEQLFVGTPDIIPVCPPGVLCYKPWRLWGFRLHPRSFPQSHLHPIKHFSSPEDNGPLLFFFFSHGVWDRQRWIRFWSITCSFIPHAAMPGHNVRACSCRERGWKLLKSWM